MIKRIFLGVLVLGLAILTIPPLRVRADPYLERMGETMHWLLEGPLSPMLNPYRRLKTQSEMGEAVRELIRDRNAGFVRPEPDEFRQFMQRELEGEDGLDGWGTPYIMVPQQDSMFIVSAGPDHEFDTEDDIVERLRFGAPAYMPRR
ncbi:MAG: hypothetical protein R3314_01590 [Longimicrobiales bacterium]|nr:hypothetical protein [Longimicrobiales bacterium]